MLQKNQIVSIYLCSKSPTVSPQVYWVNLRQLTVALFLSGFASALSTFVSPFGVVLQQPPGCLHLLGTGPAAQQFHCTLLPEESQWAALSKSKRGLGGTRCSDPRGSHTTTKSFRVSVTLLARGKNVKLPRAPIPAWSGDCALERVNCFLWLPFCWWLAALEPSLLFLPPRLLLAHYPFCLVTAWSSVAVPPCCWSFLLLFLSLFVIPFPISNLSLPEDPEWWRLDAEETTLLINPHHEEAKSFCSSRR